MSTEETTARVREIIERALGVPLGQVEDPARADLQRWDSLTHVEILLQVEDAFDVRFGEEEILGLSSLSAIVGALQDKHPAGSAQ